MNTKRNPTQLAARLGIYCLGLVVLSFGVTLSVSSNLGVSPVSSLPYTVSQILPFSLGACTTVIYALYILAQMLLSGKGFQPALLLQLVFSTLFGYFVDAAKWILGDFMLPGYLGQLAMLIASILLISFSIVLYMDVQLVPMPAEGLVACIAEKTGKSFSAIKTLFDCGSVLAAAALCLIFLRRITGIREGTILTALLVGRMTGLLRKVLSPMIRKVCFSE